MELYQRLFTISGRFFKIFVLSPVGVNVLMVYGFMLDAGSPTLFGVFFYVFL